VTLLVSLLQPEIAMYDLNEDAPNVAKEAGRSASRLAARLKACSRPLWQMLAEVPNAFGEYMQPQFLHDCADLAFYVPDQPEFGGYIYGSCITRLNDFSPMTSMIALMANLSVEPSTGALEATLSGWQQDAREELAARLRGWRGPTKSPYFELWLAFVDKEPTPAPRILKPPMEVKLEEPPPPAPKPTAAPNSTPTLLRDLVRAAPDEYKCAYSGNLLMDPVVSPYNHIFERSELSRLFGTGEGPCPITGNTLSLAMCQRAPALRKQVATWAREHQLQLLQHLRSGQQARQQQRQGN